MRIARVLHTTSPQPIVALERDGALYSVAELDRIFETRYSPERFADACDFHTRVVALSCAGLAELDDRLLAGSRPTEARLTPQSFLWLAPCATERAAYVQMSAYEAESASRPTEPRYWLGTARRFFGHDSSVPFPAQEEEPDFELGVAAILRDDVFRATCREAEQAILGYAIINTWTAREEERRLRATGHDAASAKIFGTQLGPVLVTRDEIGDVSALRAQARVAGETFRASAIGTWSFSLAESIAFASDRIDLAAGDVIGAGCVTGGSFAGRKWRLPYGTPVELTVERLGKLLGRPVRGPEPAAWKAPAPTRPART